VTAHWWGTGSISEAQAQAWVGKARRLAVPLLELAGPVADPALVEPLRVPSAASGVYGNFMLAWLEPEPTPRRVRHLPDGGFFLELLRRTYAPVLERRPDLVPLLSDDSRPEMSLTNDVLQIQLRTLDPGYSMIRHHALMLFCAALWLDEPRRGQWLDLYDELVTHVDEQPGGRPDLAELAAVEARAFADFTALAPRTLTPVGAAGLFSTPGLLDDVMAYQLYAGVAIGLLWRDYRAQPEPGREAWLRGQLSHGYVQPDYLEQNWRDHL
jgi:hypothetical protein